MHVEIDHGSIDTRQRALIGAFKQICRGASPSLSLVSGRSGVTLVLTAGKTSDIRSIRFPSRIEGVYINFFEEWRTGDGGTLKLAKAYCHLFTANPDGTEEECLALHFDPNVETKNIFERLPHFHFKALKLGLSKSHIALTLMDSLKPYESYQIYAQNFNRAIGLVNNEILGRMTPEPQPVGF